MTNFSLSIGQYKYRVLRKTICNCHFRIRVSLERAILRRYLSSTSTSSFLQVKACSRLYLYIRRILYPHLAIPNTTIPIRMQVYLYFSRFEHTKKRFVHLISSFLLKYSADILRICLQWTEGYWKIFSF